MEQMITFVMSAIGTVVFGLITNYIYDKIKSHSSIDRRKSGYEFEFKIKFKFNKFK